MYTLENLRDSEDMAAALGVETVQEVRFPRLGAEKTGLALAPHVVRALEAGPDGIEYLAFGPRHDGDGQTFAPEEFWG